ncbi:MAG: S8 family serine peptidase, partial [Candidatus Paceibacterota bacterium]
GYDGAWSTVITNPRDLTFSPSSPWTPPATGIYTLTATARDASGLTATITSTLAVFTAANYPNDYYFNTNLQTPPIYSWGQNYPDLWGLKTINAKQAWDKLYNFTRGDVNADGVINQTDISYLNSYIYTDGPAPQPFLAGDVDGNMKINIADGVALGLFVQNNTPFPTPQPLPEITIAVVDTGLDITHEDIQGNLWTNISEIPSNGIDDDGNGYVDDIHGWSFGNKNNPNVGDTVGHGTHVAGTIAGTTNNTAGVAGVCPSCKIMPLEANPLSSDNLAGGLLYAVNNGAKVISNSWGSVINDDIVNDALDIANAAGVTLVFAAGNSSADAMLFYPQKPYLITVAASDALDNPASFTNIGPRIDVAAPGADILSLHATGTDLYGDGVHTVNLKYYRASGTSMAAPHVAGLVGLILTEHPGYTSAMIRNVLRISAHDIGATGWDQASGYGRIDTSAALDVDLPVPCMASISYPINWLNPKDLTNKVIDITGTAKCAGSAMQKYSIDFKQGEMGAWQQLATNTNAVENGVLFSSWDTSIFPQGKVALRLSMTDTRGRVFQDMKEIKIGPSVKTTMPPSPIDFQNPFMAPTLADISSSTPGQEIQFAEHAFTGTGQKVPGTWPKSPADSYLTGTMSRNGTIITQRFNNIPQETTIEFLRANGNSMSSFNKPELSNYNLFRTLTSIDFNPTQKDGDEIVAMTNDNLYILNASDQQISAIPLADKHANYGFGNIDGGNDIEIYTYYKNDFWQSKIEVYKYTGQKILEINPTLYQTVNPPYMINDSADMYSSADLNHDGKDEIIAVIYQSGKYAKVVTYTYPGAILWEKQIVRRSTMLDVSPVYQPTIADINGDGKIEIVIPSNDYLYLLDENGNELWSKHGIGYAYLDNQPLIVNLDADPDMEILFTSSFGFMHALNIDGSIVNGYPVKVPGNLTYATPAVGDMDGDGLNEIVISDSMVSMDLKLTIFDTDALANNLWPQFQQNAQRTGTYALTHCDGRIAGDANGDGSVDISDAVYLISYIFSGGPAPQPLAAGDANGDGSVDISDAVYLISYIFSGGPAPKCSSNLTTVKLSANPKQNYTLQSFTKKYFETSTAPAAPLIAK